MSTYPKVGTRTFPSKFKGNQCCACQREIEVGERVRATLHDAPKYKQRWHDMRHVTCPPDVYPSESWRIDVKQRASTDRDVLVALFRSTGGANWNRNYNWDTDTKLSEWYGVQVEGGRVVALRLQANNLKGTIPRELGQLTALRVLSLEENCLIGAIPKELGNLAALTHLLLNTNMLAGTLPRELGKLTALMHLYLHENRLTGALPEELGSLAAVTDLRLHSNKLEGGPKTNESLSEWRTRLLAELAEQRRTEQSRGEEYSRLEPGWTNVVPAAPIPSSGGGDEEHMLRVQVASYAELDKLTRTSKETLDEVKRLLLGSPAAGSVPDLTNMEKLRELDRLIAMAKTLGKMASRYHEDEDIERKEMALDPGPDAYYTAVRSGLCNAYLAASVVGSGLVSTSQVGIMGKAATALKLMSGTVPLVGGLAGFAEAAMKAGDCYVQTRRVVKITDLAPDAVECSKLARLLALRLIDGLSGAAIATSYDGEEILTHRAAGRGCLAGGSTSSPGSGAWAVGMSEEAVMEMFIEQVTHCEPTNCGATTEAWRRLGMRHAQQLLTAVGQSCLQGTHDTGEKVERLLKVIPFAGAKPVATLSAQGRSFARSPVRAPRHDSSLDPETEFAAMKGELEALKLADEQRQLADVRRQAEVEAMKSDNDMLLSKVVSLEKRLPRPSTEYSVDTGGGQLFAVERKTKTKDDFWQEAEGRARATDERTVTPDEHRLTQARVEGVEARVAALEQAKRGKKGPPLPWRRIR